MASRRDAGSIDRPSTSYVRAVMMNRTAQASALRSPEAGMNHQAKPVSRPWQRFLSVSVRGLVILVLMIGGWLGWIVRGARIQREAVAAVRRTGGSVLYDWQIRGDHGAVGGEPGSPAWLVELIGVEYFGDITEVRLGVSGTDARSNLSRDSKECSGYASTARLSPTSGWHI